jgi:hypothetical protein
MHPNPLYRTHDSTLWESLIAEIRLEAADQVPLAQLVREVPA